jgi:colanic acid biosynthesis glycosyl transferase WcaI
VVQQAVRRSSTVQRDGAMRILILSQYYDPDPIPKPSEVAEELKRRGHEVFVLCGLPNYPTGKLAPGYHVRPLMRERRAGILVYRVAELPYHGASVIGRLLNYGSFLMSAVVFAFFVPRPQIIYVWHPPLTNAIAAWWLGVVHRVPFLLDVQDIWPDEGVLAGVIREGRLVRFLRKLEKFAYRGAARIVVVTEGAKRDLLLKGVPAGKIEVLPNWVDPAWFAIPTRERLLQAREVLQGDGRFIVTFAGNLGPAQGLDTVLRAADILRGRADIGFRIIGTGASAKNLHRLANELALDNVTFLGRRPIEETSALLHASDALLVHLKGGPVANVILPTKTVTYLAIGRPILMAMEGEAANVVVASGSGITTPSDDPMALSRAVLKLTSKTADELTQMGASGRAFAYEHYSKHDLIDGLEKALGATIKGPAADAQDPR